jgi:hypothetical protein
VSALIVVESHFGNTRLIADLVADRLREADIRTDVVSVEQAPTRLEDGTTLLVVGAPTHDSGLSTPESRQAASARRSRPAPALGVREWVDRLVAPDPPPMVAVFDTRTGFPWLPGSAAAQASVRLVDKGFPVIPARATFRVQDIEGPLMVGETDRAARWASALAAGLVRRRALEHH